MAGEVLVETIDNMGLYAKRAVNDKDGNRIDTTYVKGPAFETITWNGSDYVWDDIDAAIASGRLPMLRYASYDWTPIDLYDDNRYVFFTSVGEGNTFGYAQIFKDQEATPTVTYRNAASISTYTYTVDNPTNFYTSMLSDIQRGIIPRISYTLNGTTYYGYMDHASTSNIHFTFEPSVPDGTGFHIYEVFYTSSYVAKSVNSGIFDKPTYHPLGGFVNVSEIPDQSVTQDDSFYQIGSCGFIRFGAFYRTKSSTFGTCLVIRIDSLIAGDPRVYLPASDATIYYPMRLYNGAPVSSWTDTVTQGSGSAYIGDGNYAEVMFTIGVDSGGDQWQTSSQEFFTAEGWFRVTYSGKYWDYHYHFDKYNSTDNIYYKIECIGAGALPVNP